MWEAWADFLFTCRIFKAEIHTPISSLQQECILATQ